MALKKIVNKLVNLLGRFYIYVLVIVTAFCVSRYLLKIKGEGRQLFHTFDRIIFELTRVITTYTGIAVSGFSFKNTVHPYHLKNYEKTLWVSLIVTPLLSLFGFRRYLMFYFFLFLAFTLVEIPSYRNDIMKLFEDHVENIMMIGIAGYTSTL